LFCPILAEAVLLTGKRKYCSENKYCVNPKIKAGKGLTEKRAGRMAGMTV